MAVAGAEAVAFSDPRVGKEGPPRIPDRRDDQVLTLGCRAGVIVQQAFGVAASKTKSEEEKADPRRGAGTHEEPG